MPSRRDRRETLAQYYASATEVDEQVGRLIDELETQGLRENTLVVYTSDHGLNMVTTASGARATAPSRTTWWRNPSGCRSS